MSAGPATPLGRTLRRIAAAPDHPDGRLLAAFLTDRDEPAFAELVRRHGPMVLGVCRRVAGNHADADDAFQAAFLVLLRRAGGLLDRPTVGDFLYGVAYRTALKARGSAVKRRRNEARAARPEAAPAPAEPPELDRELARLPEKYRTAVVLCDLEERPRREVAAALGIPEGTLSSRLAAGRKLLADRLRSHGLAVPAAGLTAAVSPALANATVDIAAVAAGHVVGAVPPAVGKLVTEVTRTTMMTKLGMAAVVLAGGLAAGAAGLGVADSPAKPADKKAPAGKVETVTVKRLIDAERKATKDLTGTWELKTRFIDGVELKPGGKARINGQEVSLPLKYQRWTFGDRAVKVEYEWAEGDRQAGEKYESEHTVTVNPTADPPQMNIYSKGTLLLGLYRLDGDTLEFATHGISELERPKGFDPTDKRIADLPLTVDVYQRVKKDNAKPKAEAGDREKLQGLWRVVSERPAAAGKYQVRITAEKFVIELEGGGPPRELTYTLDPTAEPKRIDTTDPNAGRQVMWGIYKLDGDRLLICIDNQHAGRRPTEFKGTAGGRTELMTLERVEVPKADPPPKPKAADDRPAWRKEFDRAYALADGEVVRRVAPADFPAARDEYYRDTNPGQAERTPDARVVMGFRWDGHKLIPGGLTLALPTGPQGLTLLQLLGEFGVPPQEVEGPRELLGGIVEGDWVVRAKASPAVTVSALADILARTPLVAHDGKGGIREVIGPGGVTLTFREEEREVIVATGAFVSKPGAGRMAGQVDFYAAERSEPRGSGRGTVAEMLAGLGGFVSRRVIDETAKGPAREVVWFENFRQSGDPAQRIEDRDPDAVLPNVAAQTGLTFKVEKRKVRVLFVEPAGE